MRPENLLQSALLRRLKLFLLQRVPPRFVPVIRRVFYLPLDAAATLTRRRDDLTPPRGIDFAGSCDEDFKKMGEEFLRHFVELGKLKPDERALDVGCGIGRMAVALTNYLDESGSYDGLDIVPQGIRWCQSKITPKFPNFHFKLAEVYNKYYNQDGRFKASEYSFPYPDGSFDFVFLVSVFTHMLPEDVERYTQEISRVLGVGGRCLITFFLLNEESRRLMSEKKSAMDFPHEFGTYRIYNRHVPENAIAYEESYALELISKSSLRLAEPIHYGSWCGRTNFLSYQDVIVAFKH